jgi:hypothetical protein
MADLLLTVEDAIELIASLPDVDILPDTPQQQEILDHAKHQYKLVSLWLRYFLIDQFDDEKSSSYKILHEDIDCLIAKPYAELSLATLEFCRNVFPYLKSHVENAEQLWAILERSNAIAALCKSGYYGNPSTRTSGKILGKAELFKHNSETSKKYKNILSDGEFRGLLIYEYEAREHILEILINEAIQLANQENDENLERYIKQFMASRKKFDRTVLKESSVHRPPIQI